MAEKPRRLILSYSLLVKPRLAEIWRWSAERFGEKHATKYVDFLESRTRVLESDYLKGKPVPNRPSYRYVVLKTRAKGHGYVVVYQIRPSDIFVLYYFHTAQDWLTQLKELMP
jgi:plasmid stabilization system protein ParE